MGVGSLKFLVAWFLWLGDGILTHLLTPGTVNGEMMLRKER